MPDPRQDLIVGQRPERNLDIVDGADSVGAEPAGKGRLAPGLEDGSEWREDEKRGQTSEDEDETGSSGELPRREA